MTASTRSFAGFVFVASAMVLGAVLLSQYWGGLAPCELCLKERWPWDAALAIAALVFLLSGRVGTGLGLFLGRSLAQAMGGELDLESTSAEGSTFRMRLPLARD